MPLDNPKPSVDSVSEYLVSGHPWVTSSLASGIVGHDFNYVTKFIVVKNTTTGSNSIRVGFTENGVRGTNYLPLAPNESIAVDLKLRSIYISGSGQTYTVLAGLTGIARRDMQFLTGSIGWTGVG
jgi:hypothetical protein